LSFLCKKLKIKSSKETLVDISFAIESSFALVGQSGSGKSLTLKAILGMLPSNLKCEFEYEANFTLQRGKTLSLVPQNPFTALSPLTKIKDQFLIEQTKAQEFMDMVELNKSLLFRYPAELSGGQLQRVIIAIALSLEPKLLLLDEPTTALDHETKENILNLIKKLQTLKKFMVLFVTHDIDASTKLCSQIGVIKNGKIIESGDLEKILQNPKSDYTKTLIESSFKNREFRR
jgi:peptide/nickel transport system ATP-binding protein